jgi:hypothetical protein
MKNICVNMLLINGDYFPVNDSKKKISWNILHFEWESSLSGPIPEKEMPQEL